MKMASYGLRLFAFELQQKKKINFVVFTIFPHFVSLNYARKVLYEYNFYFLHPNY